MLWQPRQGLICGRGALDPAAAVAFSPLTGLTGLIGWWDASVFASLTLSGAFVTAMADQSGAGNNLTNTGTPTYGATQFNSTNPGIKYDSTEGDGLVNSSFPLGTGNTLTLFGVFRMNDPAIDGIGAFARMFSYTASGASHDYDNNGSFTFVRDNNTSNAFFLRNNGDADPASAAFGYHTARRLIITIKSDGTETVYIDGVSTSSSSTPSNFVSPGYLGVGISQVDSSFANQYGGQLGEAGVCTAWHDATVVASLDSYLQSKWGL